MKYLLLPFSLLYGAVMSVRNFLYDKGIFKSTAFPVAVIAVGNLTTGGTGKTPHIEYLIRLLKDRYKVVTLSRGYGRKTKGFIAPLPPEGGVNKISALADVGASIIGDEPMQYYTKFPDIVVSVGESRVEAIKKLRSD